MRKVCFGLITAAVKPGANISLQRAGIEQKRKRRLAQIVIVTNNLNKNFFLVFILFAHFPQIFV